MFSAKGPILQQLFFQNIPFIHFFWGHSLKEETQLKTIDAAVLGQDVRKVKSTPFESLEPDDESVPVPIKELDHTASPIAEYEQGTGQGICIQSRADQSAQAVEGLSHIAGRTVQIDAGGGCQGEHGLVSPRQMA